MVNASTASTPAISHAARTATSTATDALALSMVERMASIAHEVGRIGRRNPRTPGSASTPNG